MLLNVTPDTAPDPPCHVLILTPLFDTLITESLTVMFETHARELCLPRLPMLRKEYCKQKEET